MWVNMECKGYHVECAIYFSCFYPIKLQVCYICNLILLTAIKQTNQTIILYIIFNYYLEHTPQTASGYLLKTIKSSHEYGKHTTWKWEGTFPFCSICGGCKKSIVHIFHLGWQFAGRFHSSQTDSYFMMRLTELYLEDFFEPQPLTFLK